MQVGDGKRLMFGVGYNDADYEIHKTSWTLDSTGKPKRQVKSCPYATRWVEMLRRCYSEKYQKKFPTYRGCSVCEDWLVFSNFRAWMETQDWEDKHLDKDLLFVYNKIYSPVTCVFISSQINTFMTEREAARGEYPIGVSWREDSQKFIARCRNPFLNKSEYLGYHETPIAAHKAWLACKLSFATRLAKEQKDSRVAAALVLRYKNYDTSYKETTCRF